LIEIEREKDNHNNDDNGTRESVINVIALTNPEKRIWPAPEEKKKMNKNNNKKERFTQKHNTLLTHNQNDEIKLPLSPPSSSLTREQASRRSK